MRPYIVVDASVAGAWLFAEQYSALAQPVAEAVAKLRVIALAPSRFAEELLRVCQKKMLLPPAGAGVTAQHAWTQFLEVMTSPLVFMPSEELHERAWQLAGAAALTTHDALYLALAEQWGAELWTLDDMLAGPAAARYAAVRDLRRVAFPH